MSSRSNFEQQLHRLNEINANLATQDAGPVLAEALSAHSNLIVARAAEIIREWELPGYESKLASAFDYFMTDAVRRDPTCAAKIAIAEALLKFEHQNEDLFRLGMHHVQPEPVYGGHVDTAARLRAICALGYIRLGPAHGVLELAKLLADPETDARLGAVRAIANAGQPAGMPLLWYKVQVGDSELPVIHECFSALLKLEPDIAINLVASYLPADRTILAEIAALALGDSHLDEALPVLTEGYASVNNEVVRQTILLAIGNLRTSDAFSFLLGILASGYEREKQDALQALTVYRDDLRRWRKVERVLGRQ